MKNKIILYGSIVIAAILIIFFFVLKPGSSVKTQEANGGGKTERKILFYRSPMDPNQTSPTFRKDEMGMDYVPVYEDEMNAEGLVKINPAVVQNMNVKTVTVAESELSSQVITNGVLKTNETEDYIVTTRVNGYVQKLYVNYTGQRVSKGEKLMEIYSPELVSTEEELLTALSYQNSVSGTSVKDVLNSGNELVKNAVRKLQLLEIPDSEIERLEKTKEVKTNVTLYAQYSGTVITKSVLEGQKIMAGMPLLHISNLSTLWLTADIYEYELSKIQVGSTAQIRFNFLPGKIYTGKVSFIYPTIDPKSRAAKIRIDVPNSGGSLMPEMFANVEINGRKLGVHPIVPENAILRSGMKDIVIISLGEGSFKPQNVTLGGYSNGYYQVLNGLNAGDNVVTAAQFLIDSESNLKSAVSQMENSTNKSMSETSQPAKEMNMEKKDSPKPKEHSEWIRKGTIDLQEIDKNKDGKVFEDIMDWNVISDTPGKCPLCGMTLREYTIDEAKKNLIEHGFKVK